MYILGFPGHLMAILEARAQNVKILSWNGMAFYVHVL